MNLCALNFDPFDLLLGVSALGGAKLICFCLWTKGVRPQESLANRYTTNNQFFLIRFVFVRGGIYFLDLDWYIETTSKEMPLNMPKARTSFR